jgi:NAD-dependent deacetylase
MPERTSIRRRTVVVFSGAGLSAESGIPTFRDSNGLWENHRVEDVASPGGWRRDPALVLRFYDLRFRGLQAAQPNEAHRSIARLQARFNVLNITQNIDDLLERAGCENVVHLHGLITRRKCEFHQDIFGDGGYTCDFKTHQDVPVKLGDLCPKCGGQLRPDVVWFGEAVHFDFDGLSGLVEEVDRHDGVFICIGTSAQVAPASHLIPIFSPVKNKFIIDVRTRPTGDYTLLEGPATAMMEKLANELIAG